MITAFLISGAAVAEYSTYTPTVSYYGYSPVSLGTDIGSGTISHLETDLEANSDSMKNTFMYRGDFIFDWARIDWGPYV